ncbi:putative Peptidylprolyl isomerase [Syntrophobacter sp. SbD2]|nr:putative Peptidylprolyl isomerase [Syntrophobacter sp. SbD2]
MTKKKLEIQDEKTPVDKSFGDSPTTQDSEHAIRMDLDFPELPDQWGDGPDQWDDPYSPSHEELDTEGEYASDFASQNEEESRERGAESSYTYETKVSWAVEESSPGYKDTLAPEAADDKPLRNKVNDRARTAGDASWVKDSIRRNPERPTTDSKVFHQTWPEAPKQESRASAYYAALFLMFIAVACGLYYFYFFRQPNETASEVNPVPEQRQVLAADRLRQIKANLIADPNVLAVITLKQIDPQEIDAVVEARINERRSGGLELLGEDKQMRIIDRIFEERTLLVTAMQVEAEGAKTRSAGYEAIIEIAALGIEGLARFPGVIEESNQVCDRVKVGFPTEGEFLRWVMSRYGSEARYRKWTAVEMAAQKYKGEIEAKYGKADDNEVRAFFERNRVFYDEPGRVVIAQIFLKISPESTNGECGAKETQIKSIYEKLRAGDSFSELAARYSEDGNGGKGGVIGPVEKEELPPEVAAEVFRLKPNGISQVIRTAKGFHIFRLISENPQRTRTIEEVKGEIESRLRREKLAGFMPAHIAELKGNLDISGRGAGF